MKKEFVITVIQKKYHAYANRLLLFYLFIYLCLIISFICGEAHHAFDIQMHSVYNQVLYSNKLSFTLNH